MEKFTDHECGILMNGILRLMSDANDAKKLVQDTAIQNAIQEYLKELHSLNEKIYRYSLQK